MSIWSFFFVFLNELRVGAEIIQGEAGVQEEDTDDEQPFWSSSHQSNPSRPAGLETPQQYQVLINHLNQQLRDRHTAENHLWKHKSVIESPSAGGNVETYMTCSVCCVHKADFPFSIYCSWVLHCDAANVLLVLSYKFGSKRWNWQNKS